ncbi:MAG TPA: RsmD family RNA methyltransferase, partial [Nitrospirota bacterium]|nr:RsmD family RNA methyltransferase [Nitrospirota bacterium]
EQTGFADRAQVVASKAESFLRKTSEQFDIVFLDPPYSLALEPLLKVLSESGILKPDSILIAEHFKKQASIENTGGLSLYREAQYGDTVLTFYRLL